MKKTSYMILFSLAYSAMAMDNKLVQSRDSMLRTPNPSIPVELLSETIGDLPGHLCLLCKTLKNQIGDTTDSGVDDDMPSVPISYKTFAVLLDLFPKKLSGKSKRNELTYYCKERIETKHIKALIPLVETAGLLCIKPLSTALGVLFKEQLMNEYQGKSMLSDVKNALNHFEKDSCFLENLSHYVSTDNQTKELFLRGYLGTIPKNTFHQGWSRLEGSERTLLGSKALVGGLNSWFVFDIAQNQHYDAFVSSGSTQIKGFSFSKEGDVLFAKGREVLKLKDGKLREKIYEEIPLIRHTAPISEAQFTPDGNKVILRDHSHAYSIHAIESQEQIAHIEVINSGRIMGKAISNDYIVFVHSGDLKINQQKETSYDSQEANVKYKISFVDIKNGCIVRKIFLPEITDFDKSILKFNHTGTIVGLQIKKNGTASPQKKAKVIFFECSNKKSTDAFIKEVECVKSGLFDDFNLLDISDSYGAIGKANVINLCSLCNTMQDVALTCQAAENSIYEQGVLAGDNSFFLGIPRNGTTVIMWQIPSGNILNTFDHETSISSIKLSPDQVFLLTSGVGRTTGWQLRIPDIKRQLEKLSLPQKAVLELALVCAYNKATINVSLPENEQLKKAYDSLPADIKKSIKGFFESWLKI